MNEIIMRLKSGREFRFKCEEYTIKTFKPTGTLSEFSYEGGVGECPIYYELPDIECIAIIGKEQIEGLEEVPKRGKMTMQEAIDYGLRWKSAICSRGDTEWSEAIQFLNMATEALHQERTTWRTDRPPEGEEYYLTTLSDGDLYICRWTDRDIVTGQTGTGDWYWEPPQYTRVVAWMLPPDPYEESDEE